MDKDDVAHLYSRILLSHKKNELMPFAATWLDLDIIMWSEGIQKKGEHHMISLTCGILKVNKHNKAGTVTARINGWFPGGRVGDERNRWGRLRSTGRLRSINSSYKVNESRGWNALCGEYSQCCSVAKSRPTLTPWTTACQASLSFTISTM